VLGLRGAAAVARGEQPTAGRQDVGEAPAPLRDPAEAVPPESVERLFEGAAVQVGGVECTGFGHGDRVRRVPEGTAA
jgi:hypothetical protein